MARYRTFGDSVGDPNYTAYIGYSANLKRTPYTGAASYCILSKSGEVQQQCKVFVGKTYFELCLLSIWSVLAKMPKGVIVRIVCDSNPVLETLSDSNIVNTSGSKIKSQIIREKHHINKWILEKPYSATDNSYHQMVMDWSKQARKNYEVNNPPQ